VNEQIKSASTNIIFSMLGSLLYALTASKLGAAAGATTAIGALPAALAVLGEFLGLEGFNSN